MRLAKLSVRNFRSIRDQTVDFGGVTPFIGPNGSGKSTWLTALRWFYQGPPRIVEQLDFFAGEWQDHEICITATFDEITNGPDELAPYAHDGKLAVSLRITGPSDGDPSGAQIRGYFGQRMSHPPFTQIIQDGAGRKSQMTSALKALKQDDPQTYGDLEIATAWDENFANMTTWEQVHQERCELADDAADFFKPVADPSSPLHKLTEMLFVPAVHDLDSESAATGSSLVSQLVQMKVKDPAKSQEADQIRLEAEQKFQEILANVELTELAALGTEVTDVLRRYVPGTEVAFDYRGGTATVSAPVAHATIAERGFESSAGRKGNGLQRLFVVSLIEAVGIARANAGLEGEPEGGDKHRLVCVEEPELYQHPLQARQFARVLWSLAGSEPNHTQVTYTTHSPEFLPPSGLDWYRLCQVPATVNGSIPESQVRATDLEQVIELLRTGGTREDWLEAGRLSTFYATQMTTIVREGFFAQGIVLVEGIEDAAVIRAYAQVLDDPLDLRGIAIIPAGGKQNIARLDAAFTAIGLPVYFVFDGDSKVAKNRDDHAKSNIELQRMGGLQEVSEFPATTVGERFTVINENMTNSLPLQFGEEAFNDARDAIAKELGWSRPTDTQKNPAVLESVIALLYSKGGRSQLLKELHGAIVKYHS